MLGKPVVVALCLVAFCFVPISVALAQDDPPAGVVGGPLVLDAENAESRQIDPDRAAELAARLEETAARLQLTDDQREQARPILEDSLMQAAALLQGVRADGRPSFAELRALRGDLQALDDATHAQLSTILTPQQLDELSAIQEERRAELRERLRQQRANGG